MPVDRFRKPNRLPPNAYLGFGAYLVTICSHDREQLFVSPEIVEPLICLLGSQAASSFFALHAYCFMPDHLHAVLAGTTPSAQLSPLIRAFKGTSAVILRRFEFRNAWQKGFHDHVIRSAEDLSSSVVYVLDNPVRAGLVEDPREYPFSGSFVFAWRSPKLPL